MNAGAGGVEARNGLGWTHLVVRTQLGPWTQTPPPSAGRGGGSSLHSGSFLDPGGWVGAPRLLVEMLPS